MKQGVRLCKGYYEREGDYLFLQGDERLIVRRVSSGEYHVEK